MPRILGVDIPNDKPTHISLRYIVGIGPATSLELCAKARVDPLRKARELNDEEIARIATILDREYTVEGPLKRGSKLGTATVLVAGREAGSVRLQAGRSVPKASAFDRARGFVEDNLIPIALGAFVILIFAVILLLRRGRRNRLRSESG